MTKELLEKIKEIEEKLGQDWMKELDSISTPESLKQKAEGFGITFTDTMATEAIKLLNSDKGEELSEEELSAVAGGKIYHI